MTATLPEPVAPFRSLGLTAVSEIVSAAFGSSAWSKSTWSFRAPRDGAYAALDSLDPVTLAEYEDAAELEDGWAGDDTLAPTPRTMAVVRRVLFDVADLLAQPILTPTDNGTISLEWQTIRGRALLEVGDETFGLLVRRASQPSVRMNGSVADLSRDLLAYLAGLLGPTRAASVL